MQGVVHVHNAVRRANLKLSDPRRRAKRARLLSSFVPATSALPYPNTLLPNPLSIAAVDAQSSLNPTATPSTVHPTPCPPTPRSAAMLAPPDSPFAVLSRPAPDERSRP